MLITPAIKVVRSYGLLVDGTDAGDDGSMDIHTPEASFYLDEDGVEVLMWSGSYPFATEHPMGVLPSIEEAVRYAVWLLKREDFYQQQADAMWHEQEEGS